MSPIFLKQDPFEGSLVYAGEVMRSLFLAPAGAVKTDAVPEERPLFNPARILSDILAVQRSFLLHSEREEKCHAREMAIIELLDRELHT